MSSIYSGYKVSLRDKDGNQRAGVVVTPAILKETVCEMLAIDDQDPEDEFSISVEWTNLAPVRPSYTVEQMRSVITAFVFTGATEVND